MHAFPSKSASLGRCLASRAAPAVLPAMTWAAVASLALMLAGCAPLSPMPASSLRLPGQFATPHGPVSPDAAQALPADWSAYFQDEDLQALIRQALAANRDRALALARVDEARALAGLADSERFPRLAADLQAQRGRVPGDLNLSRRPLLGNQIQAGLALPSWEIDLWGRLASQDRAAREAWLASEAASQAVTLALVTQVAQTWLQLAELDERLLLARQALASRNDSLRIYTRRVEVGSTARLALTQVQVLQAQAESLVVQLQQQREASWQSLTVLLGGEPARRVPRWPELAELDPGLPASLVLRRPDILAAEHGLQASDASVQAARAAYLPRLSLTAALGSATADLSRLFDAGSKAWTVAPDLALPLLDAGRREQNLALQEARRRQALASYERTVMGALRDVNDALSAQVHLRRQWQIAQTAWQAQAERARLAQRRHDTGAAAFLEVLDAQRDLLAAEQQQVQARRLWLASRVSLFAALGGGTGQAATAPAAAPASGSPPQAAAQPVPSSTLGQGAAAVAGDSALGHGAVQGEGHPPDHPVEHGQDLLHVTGTAPRIAPQAPSPMSPAGCAPRHAPSEPLSHPVPQEA